MEIERRAKSSLIVYAKIRRQLRQEARAPLRLQSAIVLIEFFTLN
jgi:hypothetical protein